MEFEYWWLLGFPLFFGLGWLAARIDIRQIVRESRALPRSYFRGLNFLLNEQPDKAIEAFLEVVKVDPDATGTSQASSSTSDEMSMISRMSIVASLDPLGVLLPPSKLKSSWNCFQDFRAPSFCSRSVVCSEASSTCRRSASVSGTSTNSTSSSEPSSSLDGFWVADVDGLVSANRRMSQY